MFVTGKVVTGEQFIDRKKHIPALKAYLDNKQSVMLKASRRFGKTSLIKHVLEYCGDYEYIYIDLQFYSNLTHVANKIIDEAYKKAGIEGFISAVAKSSGSAIMNIMKSLKKVKIDSIGELTLEVLEREKDEVELFLHALTTAEKIAKKTGKHIYVVLDEFQEILKMSSDDVLDKFRSVAQHQECITYVFLGSVESIMNKVFENKKSPFFHFSQNMQVPPLDITEVMEYAKSVFGKLGIKDFETIEMMLSFLGGHPDYSMSSLQLLYYIAKEEKPNGFTIDDIVEAVFAVYKKNQSYISLLLASASQVKKGKDVLYAMANNMPMELPSQTLYYVKTALEDKGIIRNIGKGDYEITDILLKFALLEKTSSLSLVEEKFLELCV